MINPVLSGLIFFGGIMWGLSFLAGGFFSGLLAKFVGLFIYFAHIALITAAIHRAFHFLSNLMFTLLRKYSHPGST